MIEPVYVPYEQYRAAKTGCGLDSRIYGISTALHGDSHSKLCSLSASIYKFYIIFLRVHNHAICNCYIQGLS
jgi:hypothetical protein